MKIEELLPAKATFNLSSTGKTYSLRTMNLEDKVRMKEITGSDENTKKVFQELRWSEIAKLVYIILEDKSDFLAKEEEKPDHEGIMRRYLVTGPVMLMRAVKTQGEAIGMLQAFNASAMAAEPMIRDFVESEVKKNLPDLLTGESSSSLPQASGDTPQESSGPSQAAS